MENTMRIPLDKWKRDLQEIAGQWNGDESGAQEDRAHLAEHAIGLIDDLNEALDKLDY